MKLNFDIDRHSQPDPFIFEDNGIFYIYATGGDGVDVYESDNIFGVWKYKGIATAFEKGSGFWAPSVIKLDGKYYMYVSCVKDGNYQFMHVASSESPLGPFKNEKRLYDCFSIDSHIVKTEKGLFLWYAKDNLDCDLKGTRIYIDRFIDPYTPENDPKEVIVPDFDEEKYTPHCKPGRNWYTIEGPFWFKEGEWQYLMYSAGCFQDDTYHIGYAVAKSDDEDLKNVDFVKVKDGNKFSPLIIKNSFEEGTGHHSVIKHKGEYYAIYHGRDLKTEKDEGYVERRTARICKLTVKDGNISAQRFVDRI